VVKVAKKAKKKPKTSRKDLKGDDVFVETTKKSADWLNEYRVQLIAGCVAIFVLLSGAYFFQAHQKSQSNDLTTKLGKAMLVFDGEINKDKKSTDEKKYYPTRKVKYEAAVKAFTELLGQYKTHTGGALIQLYLGHSHFQVGQFKKAREQYMAFLKRIPAKDPMHYLGVESLARTQQALNKPKLGLSKLQSYKDKGAKSIRPFALMRLAEHYQNQKNYKQARLYYKQLSELKGIPSKLLEVAKRRLAVLP
jgi:tetratricopeptide (TPR) repeat protein